MPKDTLITVRVCSPRGKKQAAKTLRLIGGTFRLPGTVVLAKDVWPLDQRKKYRYEGQTDENGYPCVKVIPN